MKKFFSAIFRIQKSENGAVAVEAAFVIPVLVALSFLLVDVGRYYFTLVSLKSVASESARALALRMPESGVITLIDTGVPGLAKLATGSTGVINHVFVPCANPLPAYPATSTAKVTLSTTFHWFTPVDVFWSSNSKIANRTLSMSGEMVCTF